MTALVKEWISGKHQNQGFFLRSVKGGGTIVFRSKEYDDETQRPQLVLATPNRKIVLTPAADTFLEHATYRSMGTRRQLRISGKRNHPLLRFDLHPLKEKQLKTAVLRLFTSEQFGNASIRDAIVYASQYGDSSPHRR